MSHKIQKVELPVQIHVTVLVRNTSINPVVILLLETLKERDIIAFLKYRPAAKINLTECCVDFENNLHLLLQKNGPKINNFRINSGS